MMFARMGRFTLWLVACMTLGLGLQLASAHEAEAASYSNTKGASFARPNALDNKFGIGASFGRVQSVDFQIHLENGNNIHLRVGGGVGIMRSSTRIHLRTHFQYSHRWDVQTWEAGTLGPYLGGAFEYIHFPHTRAIFGLYVPVGLSFAFSKVPIDIFTEFSPGAALVTGAMRNSGFDWNFIVGLHYWF